MKSRAAFILRFLLVASGLLFIAGCLPSGLPAYTNGGKTVVALAADEGGNSLLWAYDLKSKKLTSHTPEHWLADDAKVLGDQIWVYSNDDDYMQFDPASNRFVVRPTKADDIDVFRKSIPYSFEGKKYLLNPANGDAEVEGKVEYNVLTLPGLKKTATVKLAKAVSAGDFWWITISAGIDVYNQNGKKAISIPPNEFQKVTNRSGIPFARVNADENALLFAFETKQGGMDFTFGVFDLTNGTYLWGGEATDVLKGVPFFNRKELWTLRTEATAALCLTRHSPDKLNVGADQASILRFSYTQDQIPGEYSPAPDGSNFVLQIHGKPSRLLFIPLKEGITEKDITTVDLVAEKNPASK